jgi:hypothetical protein
MRGRIAYLTLMMRSTAETEKLATGRAPLRLLEPLAGEPLDLTTMGRSKRPAIGFHRRRPWRLIPLHNGRTGQA